MLPCPGSVCDRDGIWDPPRPVDGPCDWSGLDDVSYAEARPSGIVLNPGRFELAVFGILLNPVVPASGAALITVFVPVPTKTVSDPLCGRYDPDSLSGWLVGNVAAGLLLGSNVCPLPGAA